MGVLVDFGKALGQLGDPRFLRLIRRFEFIL